MENLISLSHLIAASIALLTGAIVLAAPKGTRFHKRTGYVFAVALVGVNLTAIFMYNLTGRVNMLHFFTLISMGALFYGLWPAIRRKSENWLARHVRGMNGAALGVWAAGFAELTIRVLPDLLHPSQIIWIAVGIGLLFFFVIGFTNHYFDQQLKRHKD